MTWLSYWKFENQVGGGDEMNISVFAIEGFQVKEVGVRLVYDVEKAEKITEQHPSASAVVSEEIHRYGVAGCYEEHVFSHLSSGEQVEEFQVKEAWVYLLDNAEKAEKIMQQIPSTSEEVSD
ncbi:hypothetical protein RHMOL_Rhmol06G0213000 [Rhododendron molle]|uniref:Uncharacterized protein n=1 Tax=Rhododendron molle TaxID=49168 RepID=A0ACC0NGB0_RHOML|nr:hypothetical protein RHMOL_Rhmol06G0213000 [Rhododendron molle]